MGIALHSWRHPIARMIAGWPYQEATAPGSSMGQCHPVPSEPNRSHIVTTSRVSRRAVRVGAKVQSYHADTQQTSGPGLTIGLNSALGICCKAVRLSCGLAGRTARPSWRIHIRGPLRHDDRIQGSGLSSLSDPACSTPAQAAHRSGLVETTDWSFGLKARRAGVVVLFRACSTLCMSRHRRFSASRPLA
jgi:hypothetical protein